MDSIFSAVVANPQVMEMLGTLAKEKLSSMGLHVQHFSHPGSEEAVQAAAGQQLLQGLPEERQETQQQEQQGQP